MPRNLTPAERDRVFGPLVVTGVTGRDTVTFEQPPPLVDVPWGASTVRVHELAAPSLRLVASDLDAAGLLERAQPAIGFQPRLVRTVGGGNTQTLSAHAYGAAVDVRADRLPQGVPSDRLQREIAPHFERHGWFWGNAFDPPDAHHFTFEGPSPFAPSPPDDRSLADQVVLAALGFGVIAVAVGFAVLTPPKRTLQRRKRR